MISVPMQSPYSVAQIPSYQDDEARIHNLLGLAHQMYRLARDEDHFDAILESLIQGEKRIVALEVESRFWQAVPISQG